MIGLTSPTDFAVVQHDGTSWPARPTAQVVRWVGPTHPGAPPMLSNDEYRRYGALAPDEVADLVFHLIADNATYSGSAMTAWADEVAAAAVTISNAPAEGATLNGYTTADFDGSTDYLTTPAFQTGALTELTFLCVAQFDTTTDSNIVSNDFTGWGGDVLLGNDPNANDAYPNRMAVYTHDDTGGGHTPNAGQPSGTTDTTGYHLFGFVVDVPGDSLAYWEDGTSVDTSTELVTGDVITDRAWAIGRNVYFGNRYFDGRVAELCWWERALTATEIGDVTTYLQSKYGLS